MVILTSGVVFMKDGQKAYDKIRKTAIILFCVITVFMNIINYIRADASKDMGTVFQWTQEAEISVISDDISYDSKDITANDEGAENTALPVNLNSADAEMLQTIKGIGPTKAAAIIEYREKYGPFIAIEEIMEVPGIGEGTFAKIQDQICVE